MVVTEDEEAVFICAAITIIGLYCILNTNDTYLQNMEATAVVTNVMVLTSRIYILTYLAERLFIMQKRENISAM